MTQNLFDIKGKVVVMTGACGVLGSTIVKYFAAQGCKVVLLDLDRASAIGEALVEEIAKVVYLNCEIGPHILPEGWHNWNNPAKEKTAFYAEYACYGPGADTSARVGWAHRLSDAEAAGYTLDNVMYNPGSGTWNPLENK